MKNALIVFILSFAAMVSSQDLEEAYIPFNRPCSNIEGSFIIPKMDSSICIYGATGKCNYGSAFWAIITTNREILQYYESKELNSFSNGFLKYDSILVFKGDFYASDVVDDFYSKYQSFSLKAELRQDIIWEDIKQVYSKLIETDDSNLDIFIADNNIYKIKAVWY